MLKAYAYVFSELDRHLLTRSLEFTRLANPVTGEALQLLSQPDRDRVEQLLDRTEPLCKELGLGWTIEHIGWIRKGSRSWNYDSLAHHLDELRRRVEDSLKSENFLYVPTSRAAYYDQPELFGSLVAKNFPSARNDIVEAGNCFALGRWSATVHQCIGIMQVGLLALARHVKRGINIHTDTWEDIIRRVEEGIAGKRQKMSKARWKVVESFYSETVTDLRSVKDAWRNPDAHFRRPFNETQALKVLDKVRDFMQNLATHVRESKRAAI